MRSVVIAVLSFDRYRVLVRIIQHILIAYGQEEEEEAELEHRERYRQPRYRGTPPRTDARGGRHAP